MKIDVLILLLVVYFLIFISCIIFLKENYKKTLFTFVNIPILIYSGIGIAYLDNWLDYILKFFVYSLVIMVTITLGLNYESQKKANIEQTNNENHFLQKYSTLFLIIFYFTFIIFLIIPENKLINLIIPPLSRTRGIYEKIFDSRNILILNFSLFLRTLMTPMFLIIINNLLKQEKGKKASLLIFLWIYLSFVSMGYMGRSDILVFLIFIIMTISTYKNKSLNIKPKHIALFFIVLVVIVPFFINYQFYRSGKTVVLNWESISDFIHLETGFSKHYSTVSKFSEDYPTLNYILFYLVLPIPSIIFPQKGSLVVSTNVYFTERITGLKYGDLGYSGMLPSLFGESILVFGDNFYFIHALIVAIVFVVFIRLIIKNDNLKIFYIYILGLSTTLARGGSQGFYGSLINYVIGYIAFKIFIKMLYVGSNEQLTHKKQFVKVSSLTNESSLKNE